MKYKCVIFDVGYTLVEHNDKKETEMISKLLNIPYSEDLVNEISNFWKKSAEYTKEIIVTKEKYFSILEKMFSCMKKYKINTEDFFMALCNKEPVGLCDEVIEILECLKKNNIKMFTLSNWFECNQQEELKKLNIYNYFEKIYGWDNKYAKPNPMVIREKILNQYNNNEILLIGDGLEKDIKCAINAKIDSCWINRKNLDNQSNITPTYVINNLLEIKEIIRKKGC